MISVPLLTIERQFIFGSWRPLVRRARAHRTRRAPGGAGQGLPVFPARGAAVVSGVKAGPAGAAAGRRCAAALRPEGRPRTLARRVPPPGTRQPPEGERRSRLLLVLGRAAARRAHAASLPAAASSQATGDIMPQAECRRMVVVVLDPGGDPGPGGRPGREVLHAPQLELHGRVPRLDHRVIQRRAGPAHRLGDAQPLAGLPEQPRGVLLGFKGSSQHLRWRCCS